MLDFTKVGNLGRFIRSAPAESLLREAPRFGGSVFGHGAVSEAIPRMLGQGSSREAILRMLRGAQGVIPQDPIIQRALRAGITGV